MFKGGLTQRCTIQTYSSSTTNGHGQPVLVWANTYTSVPCRLCVLKSGREIKAEKNVVIAYTKLFVEAAQTVDEQDRVVLDSVTYGILLVERPSGKSHHKELYLEAIR